MYRLVYVVDKFWGYAENPIWEEMQKHFSIPGLSLEKYDVTNPSIYECMKLGPIGRYGAGFGPVEHKLLQDSATGRKVLAELTKGTHFNNGLYCPNFLALLPSNDSNRPLVDVIQACHQDPASKCAFYQMKSSEAKFAYRQAYSEYCKVNMTHPDLFCGPPHLTAIANWIHDQTTIKIPVSWAEEQYVGYDLETEDDYCRYEEEEAEKRKRAQEEWDKIHVVSSSIQCGYGRQGYVHLIIAKCDITGEETLCVECDPSDGEYGPVVVSLAHLNQIARERGLLTV